MAQYKAEDDLSISRACCPNAAWDMRSAEIPMRRNDASRELNTGIEAHPAAADSMLLNEPDLINVGSMCVRPDMRLRNVLVRPVMAILEFIPSSTSKFRAT